MLKKENLILNYHSILTDDDFRNSPSDDIYSIRHTEFKMQVDFLIRQQIPVVSLRSLENVQSLPDFSVSLTFDDGNDSDYELAYPNLVGNGLTAALFIPANKSNLSWGKIKEMHENGFEIGSHGLNHVSFTDISARNIVAELTISKDTIEQNIGDRIDFLAFPFGRYNWKIISAAIDSGYTGFFTTDKRINALPAESNLFHRWSIRHNVDITEFEQIICNKSYRRKQMVRSRVAGIGKRVLGRRISDGLNVRFNSKIKPHD